MVFGLAIRPLSLTPPPPRVQTIPIPTSSRRFLNSLVFRRPWARSRSGPCRGRLCHSWFRFDAFIRAVRPVPRLTSIPLALARPQLLPPPAASRSDTPTPSDYDGERGATRLPLERHSPIRDRSQPRRFALDRSYRHRWYSTGRLTPTASHAVTGSAAPQ